MSVRNGTVLLLALSSLLLLAACGGSSTAKPVAPPGGGFADSNLNGTYVFSVSGTDAVYGTPYAMVGTFTANGTEGITGGTVDINDIAFAEISPVIPPVADAPIGSSSSYFVGVDGRGQAQLVTSSPFGTIILDFVLSTSSHGLVTEFDDVATSSGTIDVQTAGTTPTGTYAFSFSGSPFSSSIPYATVGNFTLGSGGAINSGGLQDYNEGGLLFSTPAQPQSLGGSVVVSSSSPSTDLVFQQWGTLLFDVFPIDATHLKFIEMDQFATLSGDAYSQTTPNVPTGILPFTLAGGESSAPFAAGGFMVTDGSGNVTQASSEDFNSNGNVGTASSFTANYAATPSGSGRNTFTNFSSFAGGASYAAYPSSGGLLILEIDSTGITTGAAYGPQSSTALANQGYALNLQGDNLSAGTEVDDIAEFVANSTGTTVTGLIDENSTGYGPITYAAPFSAGTYTSPDANGRGSISATAGTNANNTTLNGGFNLTFYTVDGTTFPFIETDSGGQVAAGVFTLQNASAAAAAAAAHSHVFVPRPLIRPHAVRQKKN